MRQPRAEHIALVIEEYLRFVNEPAKGRGMNNPVAVPLVLGTGWCRLFHVAPTTGLAGVTCVGCQLRHFIKEIWP